MIKYYEENIIEPPLEFRDDYKPIPAPRTKKQVIKKPVSLPRTQIKETNKALEGYTTSYEISIKNNKDPLVQVQNARRAFETHIESILASMKGLKLVETVKMTFEKQTGREEKTKKSAYFNSTAQTIINQTQI